MKLLQLCEQMRNVHTSTCLHRGTQTRNVQNLNIEKYHTDASG